MSLLSLQNLEIEPLSPYSTYVEQGDVVTLSGSSGSGKSRLLYAIADLLPHAGEMAFNGKLASEFSPAKWRKQVMLLPSRIEWWDDTPEAHFLLTPSNEQLDSLNLTPDHLRQPMTSLSTGQKQRLAILRMLDRSPSVILLDEATANLDHENTLAVEDCLQQWVKGDNRAIIWCSHDSDQIERIASRTWTIKHQKVIEIRT